MVSSTGLSEVDIVQDGYTVVRAAGEIDFSNVSAFKDSLGKCVECSPCGFIIDLSGVTYFDSSGIAAMIAAYQGIRPDGKLAIVVTRSIIRDILCLIHPEYLPGMSICDGIDSAKDYLEADED